MNKPVVIYIDEHEHYIKRMPYSEVMMHMHLAGKKCRVKLEGNMAKVFPDIDKGWHTTVTPGEAGLYYDEMENRYYYTEDESQDE